MASRTPPLTVELTLDRGMPPRIVVAEDWTLVAEGEVFTVPKGFVSDGASVPVFPWWVPISIISAALALFRFGRLKSLPGSVFHDWAYGGQLPRREADRKFRRLLACNGVGILGRWLAWAGVRVGGWLHYRKEGGEGISSSP